MRDTIVRQTNGSYYTQQSASAANCRRSKPHWLCQSHIMIQYPRWPVEFIITGQLNIIQANGNSDLYFVGLLHWRTDRTVSYRFIKSQTKRLNLYLHWDPHCVLTCGKKQHAFVLSKKYIILVSVLSTLPHGMVFTIIKLFMHAMRSSIIYQPS